MIEIILSIFAIVAIIGLSIYFVWDVKKHKDENVTDIATITKDIKSEKEDRLSTLKFVVDQVNKTNSDMDAAYTDKLGNLVKADTVINDKYAKLETGFGSIIRLVDANGNALPITGAPAGSSSKVKLMKEVSVVGGMTVNDIRPNDMGDGVLNAFKACGPANAGGVSKCIEFPNQAGDVYLTAFNDTKSIVLASPTEVKNNLSVVNGKFTIKNAPTTGAPTNVMSMSYSEVGANAISVLQSEGTNNNLVLKSPNAVVINGTNSVNVQSVQMTLPKKLYIASSEPTMQARIELNDQNDLHIRAPTGRKVILNDVDITELSNRIVSINTDINKIRQVVNTMSTLPLPSPSPEPTA
jgi:hypothetical protein